MIFQCIVELQSLVFLGNGIFPIEMDDYTLPN